MLIKIVLFLAYPRVTNVYFYVLLFVAEAKNGSLEWILPKNVLEFVRFVLSKLHSYLHAYMYK